MKFNEDIVKKLIDELFDKYKKQYIDETEYKIFFVLKGLKSDEIEELIFHAYRHGIIDMGLDVNESGKTIICIWRTEKENSISEDDIVRKSQDSS